MEPLATVENWLWDGGIKTLLPKLEYAAGSRSDSRARPVLLHAATVGCVWVFYILVQDPSLVLIVGGALMFVTYLARGAGEVRRAALGLSPLSFYFIWYAAGLGASAIYAGVLTSGGDPVPFSTVRVAPQDLAAGYTIFLAGSVALHAGMQRFRPLDNDDRAARKPDLHPAVAPLAIMYVAGLVALFLPSVFAPLGAIGAPLQWAALAALSCLALSSPADLGLSYAAFRALLVIGTAGVFAGEMNSGSKAFMMYSLLPVTWLLMLHRPLRRWLPLLAIIAVLVYSAVFQVVNLTRGSGSEYSRSASNFTKITEAFGRWRGGAVISSGTSVTEQLDQFLNRQFDPTPVGFIVDQVRQGGFLLGGTMTYAAYSFIPRIIWPDKPDVTRGGWFTFYLGFSHSPDSSTTSTGQTATGELYWNFGLSGVLGGMFLIGALLGCLWGMAGADPHRQPLRMLLYVLIMMIMPNMPEAVTVLTGIASTFLIFGTAFWGLGFFGTRGMHVGAVTS
jgi:hypothetical protein